MTQVPEFREASDWWGVVQDLGVMRILATKDGGPRRTTQRLDRKGVGERQPFGGQQRLNSGHEAQCPDILVIGQNEENVWPGRLSRL
jgi:hypothetical protein